MQTQTAMSPELATLHEQLAKVAARRKAAEEAREKAAATPEAQLAEARVELAREQLAAEVAEHEVKADAIYREALGQHGFDGVVRIPSRLGSIVMRVQTEEESDVMYQLSDAHRRGAGPTPQEKALAEKNADRALNEGIKRTVLTAPAHFDRVTARYHGIWRDIWAARNRLVDGRELVEGKGVAR